MPTLTASNFDLDADLTSTLTTTNIRL